MANTKILQFQDRDRGKNFENIRVYTTPSLYLGHQMKSNLLILSK